MRERGSCARLFATARKSLILKRRDVRVVEGARLESVCRGNSTEGSNPSLSANILFRRVSFFARRRCQPCFHGSPEWSGVSRSVQNSIDAVAERHLLLNP